MKVVWSPEYPADTKCENCPVPYWQHTGKSLPQCAPGLCAYPQQDKKFQAVEGFKRLRDAAA